MERSWQKKREKNEKQETFVIFWWRWTTFVYVALRPKEDWRWGMPWPILHLTSMLCIKKTIYMYMQSMMRLTVVWGGRCDLCDLKTLQGHG